MTQDNAFQIGDHLDLFTPTQALNKYICPVCGGNDLSISQDGIKYNCYNSGGECNPQIKKWVCEKKGIGKKSKRNPRVNFTPPKDPIELATLDAIPQNVTDAINGYENEKLSDRSEMWLYYPDGHRVKRIVEKVKKDNEVKRKKTFLAYESGLSQSKVTKIWQPYHLELFSQAMGKWILFHEGEKACDYGLSKGLISTCLLGSKATQESFIIKLCEQVKNYNIKGLIYLVDNDKQGLDKAIKTQQIAREFNVKIILLPIKKIYSEAKEKDDFADYSKITNLSHSGIKSNIELTVQSNIQELLSITKSLDTIESNSYTEKVSDIEKAFSFIQDTYKDRLKFNELTQVVELDKEIADLDNFYINLAVEHKQSFSKNLAYDVAVEIAKLNPYHPVKDYLEYCRKLILPTELIEANFSLKKLSNFFFNTKEPLFNEMLYRFLIASVARIYNHGCKVDNALILQGKQGIGKSTFFKTLFSEQFFSDSLMVSGNDKDCVLTLHQHWCCELAEFETITSKKQAGELKAFLSRATDNIRAPYARTVKAMKRQGVIVGTVNNSEFLVDATGNRRFWVIPVRGKINLTDLLTLRDYVWKLATDAYFSGEPWWLSYESEALSEENNNNYLHTDAWDNQGLDNYLIGFETLGISIKTILETHLGFEEQKIQKKDQIRLGQILTKKGWSKKRRRINEETTEWRWFKDPD